MTLDQTFVFPENFNYLLNIRLTPVTLGVKAVLSWNSEACASEHEPFSVVWHMQNGAPVQSLSVVFAYLELPGMLSPTVLPVHGTEQHYHNLIYIFASSKLTSLIAQTTSCLTVIRVTIAYHTSSR